MDYKRYGQRSETYADGEMNNDKSHAYDIFYRCSFIQLISIAPCICNDNEEEGEWKNTIPSEIWKNVLTSVVYIEDAMDFKFGLPSNPLLLSVRSGDAIWWWWILVSLKTIYNFIIYIEYYAQQVIVFFPNLSSFTNKHISLYQFQTLDKKKTMYLDV